MNLLLTAKNIRMFTEAINIDAIIDVVPLLKEKRGIYITRVTKLSVL